MAAYEIELLKIPAQEIKERLNINPIALISYVVVNTNNFSNGKFYFDNERHNDFYILSYDPEIDFFIVYNDFIESFMRFNERLKRCKNFKKFWQERYIFRQFINGLAEVQMVTPSFARNCFIESKKIREYMEAKKDYNSVNIKAEDR